MGDEAEAENKMHSNCRLSYRLACAQQDGERLGLLSKRRCFAKCMASASLLKKSGCICFWSKPVMGCFCSISALQGELQRSWNLTYHRFLGCEDTGSDISDGVNPEQVNGLQRSTGRGAASFLSDGGEGYHSLSSLLNLPFHKSVWVRYYKPLLLFSATHSAWKWILSAALGSHWRLVDKVQAWVASVVDWTVFSPKTYGFWQWFQDFPLEKDSRLCHRPTVSPLANSVTFPRLSHPSHLFGL